jgi:hypothetical protein
MNKPNKQLDNNSQDEAFEMIELAIDDIQELALAFQYFSAGLRAGLPVQEGLGMDKFLDEQGREVLLN